MTANLNLHNPELEGGPFYWKSGPVGVLLSHGFTATTAEVRLLAQILHDHGYTVAGPLLPGHGTHPDEMNRCHWRDWAAAVEATYQQLAADCEKVFVGGESMGALLALYLALHHPEIVGVLAYSPALVLEGWMVAAAPIIGPLIAPFRPHFMKSQLDSPDKWQGYPENPVKAAGQLTLLRRYLHPRLPQIHQPVFVVQGRLDKAIAPNSGEMVYNHVGSALKEMHWMEKSPHTVILDCELEEIAARTLAFMERALVA